MKPTTRREDFERSISLKKLPSVKLVRVLEVQVRAEVCEAQVALIHLGGHEIGYIILMWSHFRVGTVLCGDFGPRTWQGDDKIS